MQVQFNIVANLLGAGAGLSINSAGQQADRPGAGRRVGEQTGGQIGSRSVSKRENRWGRSRRADGQADRKQADEQASGKHLGERYKSMSHVSTFTPPHHGSSVYKQVTSS